MFLDKHKPSSLQELSTLSNSVSFIGFNAVAGPILSMLLSRPAKNKNTSVRCQGVPGGRVLNTLVTVVDRCPQKATNRMTPALRGPRGKDGLCLSSR